MPKPQLTGRLAAMVGLSAALATATLVAVAAPAFAADARQTTCSEQVRVRSQPKADAPVIGSCSAGEKVTVDESKDGFTHLVNKQGWASSEYVTGEKKKDNVEKKKDDVDSDSTDPSAENDPDTSNNEDEDNDDGSGILGGL